MPSTLDVLLVGPSRRAVSVEKEKEAAKELKDESSSRNMEEEKAEKEDAAEVADVDGKDKHIMEMMIMRRKKRSQKAAKKSQKKRKKTKPGGSSIRLPTCGIKLVLPMLVSLEERRNLRRIEKEDPKDLARKDHLSKEEQA